MAVFSPKNVAKKGKQKKQKAFHPYLVSGGIFLILLACCVTVWFFGGRRLFIATTGVVKNFQEAKNLYQADLGHIEDASTAEDRINSLVGKSGNDEVIRSLADQINTNITLVEQDNTKLNLAVIALDQMTVPISVAWGKNRLTNGTSSITSWKKNAKEYYALSLAYAFLVSGITEYKEQIAGQNFDKQNSADGISSHTKMKDICDQILKSASTLSGASEADLENVTTYFTKAKTYHEKNISFYEADKKQDLTTEKLLVTDIAKIKEELSVLDPISGLSDFADSHLAPSRAKLDEDEEIIKKDFNSFKDITL